MKIYSLILLLITINLYPSISVRYYFNNSIFELELADKNAVKLDKPYDALEDMNSVQYYRIVFSAAEKAALINLSYTGNSTAFNGIEIGKIDKEVYFIKDKNNDITVDIGIGNLESIVIYTCLDFGKKGIDIYDRLATVILVKKMIRQYGGIPGKGYSVPDTFEKNKFEQEIIMQLTQPDELLFMSRMYIYNKKSAQYELIPLGKTPEIAEEISIILEKIKNKNTDINYNLKKRKAYSEFIENMSRIDAKDKFEYLKKYIEYNIQITFDNDLVSPEDLFNSRTGNYKSIAFFYYSVLKEIGLKVNSYLVCNLKKRNDEDIYLIKRKNTTEKEEIIFTYRNVKPSYNLNYLIDYNPPSIDSSVYLVTLQVGKKWVYTAGEKWIDAGIYTPERCCSDYTKKGCYYSLIIDDDIYNFPLKPGSIRWDVFFDSK